MKIPRSFSFILLFFEVHSALQPLYQFFFLGVFCLNQPELYLQMTNDNR